MKTFASRAVHISRMAVSLLAISVLAIFQVNAATNESTPLTLEKIMADPDWMGNSPQQAFWSADQKRIFYTAKAKEHKHFDTYVVDLAGGQSQKADVQALLASKVSEANHSPNKNKAVFSYQGDIYLADILSGKIEPLTADKAGQTSPQFIDDNNVSYIQDEDIFRINLTTRLRQQVASFKSGDDPDKDKKKSYLEASQPRLINYLSRKEKEGQFQKQRKELQAINKVNTWYYGNKQIKTFRLAPNGRWLLVGLIAKKANGKNDTMPEFVTADGYVNERKVRPLVGTGQPVNETFALYDLQDHKKWPIDLSNLPGINDDPLEKIARKGAKKLNKKYKPLKGPRAIYAYNWSENQGVEWTADSSQAAIILFSYDNKDRWIISVNPESKKVKTSHWMSDEAWVNDWTFNQFGWLPDNKTLYYLSEESGYSHIYIKRGNRKARQLTDGKYEVSNLTVAESGKKIFFKANKPHPGIYEIYQVDISSGQIDKLTALGGVNDYVLSPDQTQLLIRHSETNKQPELFLQAVDKDKDGSVKQLTHTSSKAFGAVNWQRPQIVEVPSSHIDRSIYSRLYTPVAQSTNATEKRPAVIFVHGAGYLQNSHQGWSGYFREFMFHNYLTQKGIVVLDMDYRASKGYGRDWRTAIYRNMGTPELEDLIDGAHWLAKNQNVDPKRIGIYGGSYGGFMTFMALFKASDEFAAGAALRPVSDWAHYNHGYTSNILNTPEVDPMAYERSSPIEFAAGLRKPLLIAHGMVDDNVFFKDSVRLVQRLIELKKTRYFETAIYPVEPHGFKQADSWLDEYSRIDMLFDRYLLAPRQTRSAETK